MQLHVTDRIDWPPGLDQMRGGKITEISAIVAIFATPAIRRDV